MVEIPEEYYGKKIAFDFISKWIFVF
jgi:hypothetical protein